MKCGITEENITELKSHEIFVYGSNESGIHGAGAARLAYNKFGAKWGHHGLHGQSYGICTKDEDVVTLPMYEIAQHVKLFEAITSMYPDKHFLITAVGTGLAGLYIHQIAPLFHKFLELQNVSLPISFINHLTRTEK